MLLTSLAAAQGLRISSTSIGTMASGPYLNQPSLNIVVSGQSSLTNGVYPYSLSTRIVWNDAPGSPLNYSVSAFISFAQGRDELVQIPLRLIYPPNGQFPANSRGTLTMTIQSKSAVSWFTINPAFNVRVYSRPPSIVQTSKRLREGYSIKSPSTSAYFFGVQITDPTTGEGIPNKLVKFQVFQGGDDSGHKHTWLVNSWLHDLTEPRIDGYGRSLDSEVTIGKYEVGGSAIATKEITTMDGYATVRITPPELSAFEQIQVIVDKQTVAWHDWQVRAVSGLMQLPSNNAQYIRIGGTVYHNLPDPSNPGQYLPGPNHYSTPGNIVRLQNFASFFLNLQASDLELVVIRQLLAGEGYVFGNLRNSQIRPAASPRPCEINDISLIYGGMFDIDGTSRPPHGGHREGRNTDIRTKFFISSAYLSSRGYSDVPEVEIPVPMGVADNYAGITPAIVDLTRRANTRLAELQFKAIRQADLRIIAEGDHWHTESPD